MSNPNPLGDAKDLLFAAKEDLAIWLDTDKHTIAECSLSGNPCSTHEILNKIDAFLRKHGYWRLTHKNL